MSAPRSKLEMERQTYAAAMKRATAPRFTVYVPSSIPGLSRKDCTLHFPNKREAQREAERLTKAGRKALFLDRRTGMYLDPATGQPLPADQQLTNGGSK